MSDSVHITVPLVPPSVNHYKVRTRKGVTYVTKEAKAFKEAVALCSLGKAISAEEYAVTVGVFLGKGGKGDCDNFLKVTLDGLVYAGVIHSDAAITKLTVCKGRDCDNPRTEIVVEAL